jgi:hypothetical protein
MLDIRQSGHFDGLPTFRPSGKVAQKSDFRVPDNPGAIPPIHFEMRLLPDIVWLLGEIVPNTRNLGWRNPS